jgi:alkylated DNA repair protein alkB family protein 8
MEDDSAGGSAGNVRFGKHRGGCKDETPTEHLYVANCGPAVGLQMSAIEEAFSSFGELAGMRAADDSGTRMVISFQRVEDAVAAKEAWSGQRCGLLMDRVMLIQYSVPRPLSVVSSCG